jgi:hypothetical protein
MNAPARAFLQTSDGTRGDRAATAGRAPRYRCRRAATGLALCAFPLTDDTSVSAADCLLALAARALLQTAHPELAAARVFLQPRCARSYRGLRAFLQSAAAHTDFRERRCVLSVGGVMGSVVEFDERDDRSSGARAEGRRVVEGRVTSSPPRRLVASGCRERPALPLRSVSHTDERHGPQGPARTATSQGPQDHLGEPLKRGAQAARAPRGRAAKPPRLTGRRRSEPRPVRALP